MIAATGLPVVAQCIMGCSIWGRLFSWMLEVAPKLALCVLILHTDPTQSLDLWPITTWTISPEHMVPIYSRKKRPRKVIHVSTHSWCDSPSQMPLSPVTWTHIWTGLTFLLAVRPTAAISHRKTSDVSFMSVFISLSEVYCSTSVTSLRCAKAQTDWHSVQGLWKNKLLNIFRWEEKQQS